MQLAVSEFSDSMNQIGHVLEEELLEIDLEEVYTLEALSEFGDHLEGSPPHSPISLQNVLADFDLGHQFEELLSDRKSAVLESAYQLDLHLVEGFVLTSA